MASLFVCVRVTWRQLEADVQRDRIRIDGVEYSSSSVRTLVVALADRVLAAIKRVAQPASSPSTPSRAHTRTASTEAPPDAAVRLPDVSLVIPVSYLFSHRICMDYWSIVGNTIIVHWL